MTIEELNRIEAHLTETFLDQVAEFFDRETLISPDTLFESDGYMITARALLQRIRLHEALERLN